MSDTLPQVSERAYGGALERHCECCGAGPGEYCTRVDDNGAKHIRRAPCVRRIRAEDITIVDDDSPEPVDFGAPRHERGELW